MPFLTKYLKFIVAGALAVCVVVLHFLFPGESRRTEFATYGVGLLLFLQVWISNERTASTEKGNVAERFKNAIEHLGNDSASVRLGGIYALHHIAQEEENYRARVFEILCAHIRETTTQKQYKSITFTHWKFSDDNEIGIVANEVNPAIEIQSILKLAFTDADGRKIYKGLIVNLVGAKLQGADFSGCNLESANLAYSNLESVDLNRSNCAGAIFNKADLKGAVLDKGNFQHASFLDANLEDAIIGDHSGLTVDQLLRVTSLFATNLPDELKDPLYKKAPELFKPF